MGFCDAAGSATVRVATKSTITKGHAVYFVFHPTINEAPNIISDNKSTHAKSDAAGKPKPANIPVIPAGSTNFIIPGTKNKAPVVILSIANPYPLLHSMLSSFHLYALQED